jgi:hypothetical protein
MHWHQLCGSYGTDKMCVFLHPVTEMNDQFLQQQINIKFWVKLEKNASHTCAMPSDTYGGEAMKMLCFLVAQKVQRGSQECRRWKM